MVCWLDFLTIVVFGLIDYRLEYLRVIFCYESRFLVSPLWRVSFLYVCGVVLYSVQFTFECFSMLTSLFGNQAFLGATRLDLSCEYCVSFLVWI